MARSSTSDPAGWPGRRPTSLLIWSVTLSGITANTLIAPVVPDITSAFGRPDSAAGLVVAAAALPGVVAAPVIGVLADRVGRRRVLVPCLALFGAMSVVAALAPEYWVLVTARFVMGIGAAGLINLAVVLIGDHWTGAERIRQVGRNAAVLTAGLALLPTISGVLATAGSWRWALAPSALALVTAFAAWRELDDVRPPHGATTLGDQVRGARVLLGSPVMLATVASGFLIFVMIFGLVLTTLPVHLEREFGQGAAARGVLLAVPSVSSTLVALNLARLRAAMGLRLLLVAGAALFGLSLVTIGLAAAILAIVLGLLVYGIAEGFTIPSLQEITAARAPASQRGTVLAVWVAAVRAGQAIGPLLFAAVFATVGTGPTLVVGAALALPVLALHAFTGIGLDPEEPAD